MKIVCKFIAITVISLFLTSCVGEEPNDIGYITALGIDKSEEEFIFSIQVANPTKISGGAAEEGGSGGNIVENVVVKAPTMYAALNNADNIVSKELSMSHAKVIVVSEEVAKSMMREITDVIARNNDIRPDVYIAVAEDAEKYLEGVKPVVELNPVKYYQLIYENKKGGAVPQNDAAKFYMSIQSGDRDCVLPLSGIVGTKDESGGDTDAGTEKEQGEGNEKPVENGKNKDAQTNEQDFQNKTKNYFAGEAGEKIKNKSETLGLGVFKGDTYICRLGSVDAELYNILMHNMKWTRVSFYSGEKQPITMRIEEKTVPRYAIDKEKKQVQIKINLEAELLSAPEGYVVDDKILSEMVDAAMEEFLDRAYNELKVDIYGIKGKLKKQFLTIKSYNEYAKSFSPDEWTISVNTKLKTKRSGMTHYY